MSASEPKAISREALFVNAFVQGAIKTFQVQCTYPVSPLSSYLLDPAKRIDSEICGVIGLTSDVFSGSISLCFSEKFFLGVMGSMFGETYSVLTDEIADGAGELANIIFGTAKTILTDSGFSLEKALPTIIRGSDIKLSSLSRGGPMIVVPFKGTDGLFHILISLSRNGKEEVKQPFSQVRP